MKSTKILLCTALAAPFFLLQLCAFWRKNENFEQRWTFSSPSPDGRSSIVAVKSSTAMKMGHQSTRGQNFDMKKMLVVDPSRHIIVRVEGRSRSMCKYEDNQEDDGDDILHLGSGIYTTTWCASLCPKGTKKLSDVFWSLQYRNKGAALTPFDGKRESPSFPCCFWCKIFSLLVCILVLGYRWLIHPGAKVLPVTSCCKIGHQRFRHEKEKAAAKFLSAFQANLFFFLIKAWPAK